MDSAFTRLGAMFDCSRNAVLRPETVKEWIDELAPRLIAVVDRMEAIVERVERIVGVGEAVVSPIAATENAVREAISAVRSRTGL